MAVNHLHTLSIAVCGEGMRERDTSPPSLPDSACLSLIGMAGAGKTTVGVILAQMLGWPHLDTVTPQLKAKGIKNVTLMPLMMVAGDHANNDMAGDEPDSFKSQLEAEGFKVSTYIPDRADEGYGISDVAVERIVASQVQVMVTVDCGITARRQVEAILAGRAALGRIT